jgi:hypothetical protein
MGHQAWALLYCAHSPYCDERLEREHIRNTHHAHEYEEILQTLASISQAIDRKDWQALGF